MPIMWKPASTWTTSPVVEAPRSDSSQSAQPATPSIEVSCLSAEKARPCEIMPRPPEMPASDRVRMAPADAPVETSGESFGFSLVGQDRPGIVDQVTAVLSGLGANIESFNTRLSEEPHSGAPLFHLAASLRLPAGLSAAKVQDALEAISGEIMVDVTVSPAG